VPEEGVQIVSENGSGALEIIGHVTSSRYSPTLGEAIGLCWLPAALAEAGNAFTIRTSEGRLVEAVVHEGPFYDPEGERLQQ
jgi:sarcosine oxidase subunit alpha